MAIFRLKQNFTAGELSPLMHDRIDFERYNNGCKQLTNMFCTAQGPASRRPGIKFVYDLSRIGIDTAVGKVRLVPFIFNEVQAYVMVFYQHISGKAKVVFATTTSANTDGLVTGDGVPCEYTTEGSKPFTAVGDYVFNFPPGATASNPVVWHIADSGGTKTSLVLTTDYTIAYDTVAGTATVHVTKTGLVAGTLFCQLDISVPAISQEDVVTIELPSGWDIEKFDYAQSGDEMYFAQPDLQPHIIKRYGHACWELVAITFANQPTDWSDINGWPEKVTFHQQRIAFAANKLRRQTVWLSMAGNFNDFGTSTPMVASDGVAFTLDSGTQNRIQWIMSGKSLHVGTMGNEWTVSGGDQAALTPSNILAQRQTNNGSEPNKPLLVGLTTLFVERHGRTVNEFVYDYTFDSYKTSDMAILSPHVTEKYSIIDWTYQQTPDSIIWCVREDGGLLGITYQRQHKVIGWHQHNTVGKFKACTTIPGVTREDDVWFIVERAINGAKRFYLEKLEDWFKSDDAVDGRFLDSHLVYSGDPVSEITGVTHLRNTVVEILADGTVHPPVLVDNNGTVKLNRTYSTVVVGLPYTSEVRPELPDITGQTGTAQGRMQRITNVAIDLYRSLGMYIGQYNTEEGEYEEEVPFRVPGDLMGAAVPLYTGWYYLSFPEGYDREAEYFIRQKQPLPLTVRGVVDDIEVYD